MVLRVFCEEDEVFEFMSTLLLFGLISRKSSFTAFFAFSVLRISDWSSLSYDFRRRGSSSKLKQKEGPLLLLSKVSCISPIWYGNIKGTTQSKQDESLRWSSFTPPRTAARPANLLSCLPQVVTAMHPLVFVLVLNSNEFVLSYEKVLTEVEFDTLLLTVSTCKACSFLPSRMSWCSAPRH